MTTRLSLAMALLLAWLLSAVSTQAAPAHSGANAGAHQATIDPHALRVPEATFSPATLTKDYVPSNSDIGPQSFIGYFHNTSYADLGRVSGYYESARWTPTSGPYLSFVYNGSIYGTATAASAAYADAKANFATKAGAPLTPCNARDAVPPPCDDIALVLSDNRVIFFREVQVGVCVAEIAINVPTKEEADANGAQIHQTNNAITLAAMGAMSKVCGTSPPTPQVSVQISSIGLAHKVKGKVKMTHAVKVGEGALFVAIYKITSGATATATMTIGNGNKTSTVDMRGDTLKDGTPYFYYAIKFGKKYVGKYQATITVTSGSASDSRRLSFTVTKRK